MKIEAYVDEEFERTGKIPVCKADTPRAPFRRTHSSFKQLVILKQFTVTDCYRQMDNITSTSSIQLSCCLKMGD
jgi:hypothetical protein